MSRTTATDPSDASTADTGGAPLHPAERARLDALRSLDVLDTEPEQRFDRLTRLACRLLGVPIALVSLVDEDRQWFKSAVGLDMRETPREVAFCAHTILGEGVFEVPDASLDPRFLANPLVCSEPSIRFYAGAPIHAGEARLPVGTLCLIDQRPRRLSPDEQDTLRELAALVEDELGRMKALAVARAEAQRSLMTDSLTGLPSELLFLDRLRGMIEASAPGRSVAVAVVDIDGFSGLNRSLGRAAGDEVLQGVARWLRGTVPTQLPVARGPGDEFLLAFESESADSLPRAMPWGLEPLQVEVPLDGETLRITGSVGIASCVVPESGAVELLDRARAALAEARRSGAPASVRFHDSPADARLREDLDLLRDLANALKGSGLRMDYQPKVSLSDGQLLGFEALMRWEHPELGRVSPGRFVPLSEQGGLVEELSRFALEETCAALAAWRAQGFMPPPVSVNISPVEVSEPSFVGRVSALLERHALPPELLVLEVTERSLAGDLERTRQVLGGLRELGVKISIDDFGTGYSCLAYLASLPVDRLKIDRAFVIGLDSAGGRSVTRAILSLAESLGLQCVAEGVEEPWQAATLLSWGCVGAQGWLFSRAVSTGHAGELVARAQGGGPVFEVHGSGGPSARG